MESGTFPGMSHHSPNGQPPAASPSRIQLHGVEEVTSLVPDRIPTFVAHGNFSDCKKVIATGRFLPMFVTGLSGNGKTTMIDQVCAQLGREMVRVNLTILTDEDDLIGGYRLHNGSTVWQDGAVVVAMKRGAVLLLDEVDLGSPKMMCLQPVLEGRQILVKKTGEVVRPAPGFTVVATANTKGQGSDDGKFVGTNVLNEAFLDRFALTIEQEYATPAQESKIVLKRMEANGKVDSEFAELLVAWADITRKTFRAGGCDSLISTRRLIDAVSAWTIFDDKAKAIAMICSRFDAVTSETFISLFQKCDKATSAGVDDAPQVAEAAAPSDPNAPPF